MTPEVTRDVCLLARMMAANLYYSQIEDLMFEVFTPFALCNRQCKGPYSSYLSAVVYVALQ